MAYDYSKLLGRITEKFGTQARFSGAMGMSERSLSLKLNSKVPFKAAGDFQGLFSAGDWRFRHSCLFFYH